jgi:hypothetical protein
MFRKILSSLHSFGGLLFFPLLIIFGVSALHINHKLGFLEPRGEWSESQATIKINDNNDKQQLSEAIRDSLGLMGWCPYWTQSGNKDYFKFDIVHNGAEYHISADLANGSVRIKRKPKGAGSILNSLHFFNEDLPSGTKIVNSWKYYKDLCFIYLIIAVSTGIWFALKMKKRRIGLLVLSSSLILSIILLIIIWLS